MEWLRIREIEGPNIASAIFGSRTTQVFSKRFLKARYNL